MLRERNIDSDIVMICARILLCTNKGPQKPPDNSRFVRRQHFSKLLLAMQSRMRNAPVLWSDAKSKTIMESTHRKSHCITKNVAVFRRAYCTVGGVLYGTIS